MAYIPDSDKDSLLAGYAVLQSVAFPQRETTRAAVISTPLELRGFIRLFEIRLSNVERIMLRHSEMRTLVEII